MKRMNFIDKISSHKHQQVTRWFLFSSATLGTALTGIILFQAIECYEWYALRTHLQNTHTQLDALQTDCKAKEVLHQKKSSLALVKKHIYECTLAPCSPHDTLCILTKLTALPVNLQSVQLHQEGIEVTALATNLQHATQAIAQLKQGNQFAHLELISITPGQKGLLFRIKATK